MTSRCRQALVALLVAILCPQSARAFYCEEHARMVAEAFEAACEQRYGPVNQIKTNDTRMPALWCRRRLGSCFGHWVAVAADQARKPAELIEKFDPEARDKARFLHANDGSPDTRIDCLGLPDGWDDPRTRTCDDIADAAPASEHEAKKALCFKTKLVTGWGAALEEKILVATNIGHFQPCSVAEWKIYSGANLEGYGSSMVDKFEAYKELCGEPIASALVSGTSRKSDFEAAGISRYAVLWANSAFAIHYLTDSFAGGHIGLKRRPLDQDYSQAYHDDLNARGQFLSSPSDKSPSDKQWFTFGDQHWGRMTNYLRQEAFAAPQSNETLRELLRTDILDSECARRKQLADKDLSGKTSSACDKVAPALTDADIANLRKQVDDAALANVASSPVVLFIANEEDDLTSLCYWANDCEKFEYVLLAKGAAGPQTNAKCTAVVGRPDIIRCDWSGIVKGAVTHAIIALFAAAESKGDPSTSKLIGEQLDLASEAIPNMYRVVLEQNEAILNNKTQAGVYDGEISTMNPKPVRFTQWGYFVQDHDDEGQGHKTAAGFGVKLKDLKRFSVNINLQVLAPGVHLLDGWEASGYFLGPRFLKNAVDISVKGTFGIDHIWQSKERARILGYGPALNINAGKHVVFVEVERLSERVFEGASYHSTRLMAGIRFTSIDLVPQRQ